MKLSIIVLSAVLLLVFTGCQEKKEAEQTETQQTEAMGGQNNPDAIKVKVLEHMDAASYTYIRVDEAGEEYWIAVPQMEVEDGEELVYTGAMEMKDFHSESLDRTFESILFIGQVAKANQAGLPQGHPAMPAEIEHPEIEGVEKTEVAVEPISGGVTVANIYTQSRALSGKEVAVRGKVMKINKNIMGKNWVHLQDGTDADGNFDLVVTTSGNAEVGDIVVVKGVLATDRDFGAGYKYNVLIEDADMTVEEN